MPTPMPLLHADRITKRFPGVTALADVSFDLRPGEVHALCGENGAGKSTLIKVLAGMHPHGSYDGEIRRDGAPLRLRGVRDAEAAGIAVICQELALVQEMTVAENICLGQEPTRGGLIDWLAVFDGARKLLQRFALDIDPAAKVRDLGVGQQQLVEIVKALGKQSRILILDEPTAALSAHEVQTLLAILRDLRQRGVTCVYISHKLDEVFAIADRITVLRDGRSIVTLDVAATDKATVIRHMVGREITEFFPRQRAVSGVPGADPRMSAKPQQTSGDEGLGLRRLSPSHPPVRLSVRDLCVARPDGKLALEGISFDVCAGEVLGIGGLMGAGRTELLMHLFGAWGRRVRGQVALDGRPLDAAGPDRCIRAGLVLVSEDRKRYGVVPEQSIGFNLSLSTLAELTTRGLIDPNREHAQNRRMFDTLRIRAPSLETPVASLSGGNQQKVVLGKALLCRPGVVFLDEPTRGIDVGAKVEVYELINRLTAEGQAVVLVSSELPELMGMSDHILMLHEGRIGGGFAREEATQEKLMAAAMGGVVVGG